MSKRGPNEGSIFQRTDGRWVAVLNQGWQNGKRVRKSYYGETRKSVQEQLTRVLADVQKGIPVTSDKETVDSYFTWWLEEVVKRKNRPTTYASYEGLVRLHIKPALGAFRINKLTTQQLRTFLNQKQDSGLSSRTVQYLHAVVRKALNVALRDQLVSRNVAALVEAPRVIAKEVQPLTPEEARRFLETIKGDRLEALFTVAISLGLRQGEALALRWQDVDLEAGRLRVRYALQRFSPATGNAKGAVLVDGAAVKKPSELHLVEPKTKKSRRTIDLPSVTLHSLAAHLLRQKEERRLAGSRWLVPSIHCEGRSEPVDDFVFASGVGTPLDSCNITKYFQRLLKQAEIAHHRFHDLRHTAATLLAVQGVHAKTIQSVLGWDQVAMVDRYTHFVDEMRKEAANQMDAILKPVAVKLAVKEGEARAN